MAAIDLLFTFLIAVSNSELLPWAELFLILAAFALVLFVVVVGGLCLGLIRALWALCGPMCWACLGFFFLLVNAWVFAVVIPAWLPPPYLYYYYYYYYYN